MDTVSHIVSDKSFPLPLRNGHTKYQDLVFSSIGIEQTIEQFFSQNTYILTL